MSLATFSNFCSYIYIEEMQYIRAIICMLQDTLNSRKWLVHDNSYLNISPYWIIDNYVLAFGNLLNDPGSTYMLNKC